MFLMSQWREKSPVCPHFIRYHCGRPLNRKKETEDQPPAHCCLCERELSYPYPTLALEAYLESLTAEQPRPKLTAGFDEAAVKLTALHKHVADSAHFLPAFDARQAQEVKSLTAGQPPFLCRCSNPGIHLASRLSPLAEAQSPAR